MYFQKTMFVANPGSHQQPHQARHSTARPAKVVHPASGSTPGPVPSGTHERVFSGTDHQPAQPVARLGPVAMAAKRAKGIG